VGEIVSFFWGGGFPPPKKKMVGINTANNAIHYALWVLWRRSSLPIIGQAEVTVIHVGHLLIRRQYMWI